MTIELKCEGCQHPLRLADELAGKRAKCAKCGTVFTIPSPTEHFWPPGMEPPGAKPKPAPPKPAPPRSAAPSKTARPARAAAPPAVNAPAVPPAKPAPVAAPAPLAAPAPVAAAAPVAAPVAKFAEASEDSSAPLAAPLAAPVAMPVSSEEFDDLIDDSALAIPLDEALSPEPASLDAVRDTRPGIPASTRDTVRTSPTTTTSRPIPLDAQAAPRKPAPEAPQRLQFGDVFARTRGAFRANVGRLSLAGLMYLVTFTAAGMALAAGLRLVRAPQSLQAAMPQALLLWLNVGLVSLVVKTTKGRYPGVGALFGGMPLFLPALAIWAICYGPIYALAAGLELAEVYPGTVALISLGLWLSVTYFVAIPSLIVLVDHQPRPLAALREATSYSAANFGVMLGMSIVSLLALVIGLIPCGLGAILAIPFVLVLQTVAYLRSRAARN